MEPDCSFDELARRLDRLESRVDDLERADGPEGASRLADDIYESMTRARLGERTTPSPNRGRA